MTKKYFQNCLQFIDISFLYLLFLMPCLYSVANSLGVSNLNNNFNSGMSLEKNSNNTLANFVNNASTSNDAYRWQQSNIDSLNNIGERSINWQERKILKQRTNDIYAKIVSLIDDMKIVFNKFKNKINEIELVLVEFKNEVNKKSINFGYNVTNQYDLFNLLSKLINKWNKIKSTDFYKLNKEFREKIDELSYGLDNINKMKIHFIDSEKEFDYFIETIIASLKNLNYLEDQANNYENLAWEKYEKLDELITESQANDNYYSVINYFDNIVLINNYLRNNYLYYLNNAMHEISISNDSILVLFDNIINSIIEMEKIIESYNQEIIAFELKEKEKLLIEQQEKIYQEAIVQKKEEEKKLKQIELLNQKKIYIKILDSIVNYYEILKNKFFLIFHYLKNILLENNFIKNIIGNKDIVRNKEDKKAFLLKPNNISSTEVSSQVSSIKPQEVLGRENIQVYSINPISNNQGISPVIIDQIANIDSGNEKNYSEDVFNNQKSYMPLISKNKSGASSYPIKIQPHVGNNIIINNLPNSNDTAIFGIDDGIVKSEENIIDVTNIKNNNEKKNNNEFRYNPLDKSNNLESKEEPLLPVLSSNIPVNNSNRMILNEGIAAGGKNGFIFEAQSSSESKQPRRSKRNPSKKNKKIPPKKSVANSSSVDEVSA